MSVINEIRIGTIPKFNGMIMYRKYNSELGFNPHYKFIDDNTLSMESKIIVNYIEYFKNENGDEITELRKYKYYVVTNIPAIYKQEDVVKSPAVYYNVGEVYLPAVIEDGVEISPAVLADGTEVKSPPVIVTETVEDKPAWLAANNWFISMSRTPITAQVGIMDSIEGTLAALPIDVPNGYVLQTPN